MNATQLIDALGGTIKVAELTGVKAPSVSGWKEAGKVPFERRMKLVVACEERKIATRFDLFPDDWHLIWPELIGIKGSPKPKTPKPEPEKARA